MAHITHPTSCMYFDQVGALSPRSKYATLGDGPAMSIPQLPLTVCPVLKCQGRLWSSICSWILDSMTLTTMCWGLKQDRDLRVQKGEGGFF